MKRILPFLFLGIVFFSSAQTYPFADGFQSYSNFSTLGTQGGYMSDMSVYQTHGMGNSDKGLRSGMNNFNTKDSTVSPLIGPLTTSSQLSFFYRIMNPAPQYPFVPATIGSGDVIEVYIGLQSVGAYQLAYTINSANNIADTAFKMVKITVPSSLNGMAGNVKFVVRHPANGNDFDVDIDSLVVKDSAQVNNPLSVSIAKSDILCYGACNGSAVATASGGNLIYTYAWSDTALTTANRTNLCPGVYVVTVTDNLSNTATASVEIGQPDSLTCTGLVSQPLCNGDSGCINLTVAGGTGTYDYLWNNALSPVANHCDLLAGTYELTVLDGNNCSLTATFSINTAAPITFSSTHTNLSSIGIHDGSIQITVSGDSSNLFKYSIDGGLTFDSLNSFNNLSAGCYHLAVMNFNHCVSGIDTVCLTEPSSVVKDINEVSFRIYPNPSVGKLFIEGNNEIIRVKIYNAMGDEVMTFSPQKVNCQLSTVNLAAGVYIAEIQFRDAAIKKRWIKE